MNFSVSLYIGDSAMKPWPALAGSAFCLKYNSKSKDSLFFFDTVPPESGASNTASKVKRPKGTSAAPSNDSLLNTMMSSAPIVVFIHGLGDEADSWRHVIPLLNSRGYRALALDLPGFGRSAATGKINLDSHTAAVIWLIEAINQTSGQSDKGVFLAGNSLGALVAESVALERPELTRGLILIDGCIPGGPSNPGPFVLAKLLFSRKWYRAYQGNPEEAWASLNPYYADLGSLPLADQEFLRQRVMARVESRSQEKAFFETQGSLIKAYLSASPRFARGIRNYKGKILLLWGDNDRIIPLSSANKFKALREDIELEIIPGAGHLPQQENPEETTRLMADFMARVVD